TSDTCAGVHSAFAWSFASHLPLHSALICGGVTLPVHFGASIFTLQSPLQVPSHFAEPWISQLPPHLPVQEPEADASHLPSQLPAQEPVLSLPSHLPSHLPPQVPLKPASHEPLHVPLQAAAALISHEPLHSAEQVPWSLPGSHCTSALPG